MPILILLLGAKNAWGPVRWPLIPATMVITCPIGWGTLWGTSLIWLAQLRHRS